MSTMRNRTGRAVRWSGWLLLAAAWSCGDDDGVADRGGDADAETTAEDAAPEDAAEEEVVEVIDAEDAATEDTVDPPATLVCTDLKQPGCDPGPLDPNTTYYWYVVANSCCATTVGPVWNFTTGAGPGWCLGDSNCSGGSPDFNDIEYFVAALTGEASWVLYYQQNHGGALPPCPYLISDMNGGGVEFTDIAPFVQHLGAPCDPYVP